jgi:hypothetical protein
MHPAFRPLKRRIAANYARELRANVSMSRGNTRSARATGRHHVALRRRAMVEDAMRLCVPQRQPPRALQLRPLCI